MKKTKLFVHKHFLNKDISVNIDIKLSDFQHVLMRYDCRETCLRFLIQVIVFILCNLEKQVLKNEQKLPLFFFLHKMKTKALIKK